MEDSKEIYFAGGCFWGTEHLFNQVPGVIGTEVGYANSKIAYPDYREVCTGTTGAAEAVKVTYDPSKVELGRLIELYMLSIDPTSVDRQGNDSGTQYRTGIYIPAAGMQRVLRNISNHTGRVMAAGSQLKSGRWIIFTSRKITIRTILVKILAAIVILIRNYLRLPVMRMQDQFLRMNCAIS